MPKEGLGLQGTLPTAHSGQGASLPCHSRSGHTVFVPWTVVIKRFSLAEDLQGGIARNIEPFGQVCFRSGVDFSQGYGGRALAQLLGSLLVLRGQFLTVSTPARGSQFVTCSSMYTASQLSQVQKPNLCFQAT